MKSIDNRLQNLTCMIGASIIAGSSVALAASGDPNIDPTLQPDPPPSDVLTEASLSGNGSVEKEVFGTARGSVWIDATRFTHPLDSGAPHLTYDSFHYYYSPGSASPERYFAPIDNVPTGALMDQLTCAYNDSSATNNIYFSVQKYTTDFSTSPATRTAAILTSFSTSGTPGVGFGNADLSPAETLVNVNNGVILVTYHISADIANDTSFAGCLVYFTRQISPPPGVPSFTDVPTTDIFYAAIEALKASGVTTGCAPGLYCPNDPVTRGQMAAFLSRALGLHWPN